MLLKLIFRSSIVSNFSIYTTDYTQKSSDKCEISLLPFYTATKSIFCVESLALGDVRPTNGFHKRKSCKL